MKSHCRPIHRFWLLAIGVLLLGMVCAGRLAAAENLGLLSSYVSREWQSEEGLPSQAVLGIAQTKDGYLWVGTKEGLARFDGMSFTVFDSKNTPEIKSDIINALCADQNGALWIGTETGGLVRLQDGVFTHFGKTDGLAGDLVRAIHEGWDGSLWFGTLSGMSRFKDGKFINYNRDYSHKEETLLSDYIASIYLDRSGLLWIATAGGVNRLEKDGRIITPGPPTKGFPRGATRGIAEGKDGDIWVGANNGVFRYHKGKVRGFNRLDGLSHNIVRTVFVDGKGTVWAGSEGGLDRWDGERFVREVHNEDVPYDQVNAMFQDREESLWVGSKEGLIRLTPRRFYTYTTKQGLSHNNVMSVMEDHIGNIWLGTWGGLNELTDGKVTAYGPDQGITREEITATTEGRDGSIWVGADWDGGLTRMKDGHTTQYTLREGMVNGGVRVIHEDRSGNLWIGTSKGLSRFRDGKFTNFTSTNGAIPGDVLKVIFEDHAGNLWFGSEGGLSRWTNGHFVTLTTTNGLSHNAVVSIYEDAQNDLWVGTQGGGLNRLRDGNIINHYTTREGLFNDYVFEILEDDRGYLWMSCLRGIFRVSKQELSDFDEGRVAAITSISYGRADGLLNIQCNGVAKPAGWRTRDGRLWFPSTRGLISVDRDIKVNSMAPPVFIEQVRADRKPMLLRGPVNQLTAGTAGDAPLKIPPGRGEMEFQYTALSLQTPEKNRFRYKLEGVDSEWVEADTRRTVHYSHIYPGDYRFRVMACNDDGIWNEAGASVAFEALPHYWQTWWFQGAMVFAAIGAIGGTARHLTKERMQRQLELLERKHAVEKERSRIAQDMHDELGARLTEIMLVSDRAQEVQANGEKIGSSLGKISTLARSVVGNLDMLVWTVNPKNDSVDKLAVYICEYVQNYLEASSIQCRFDVPHDLPRSPLTSEVRHNVLLVVKEALNNAVKHSHGSEVSIRLQMNGSAFLLWMEDNGRGFEMSPASSHGNGLQNMEKRMRTIGGAFELTGGPGKGTRIHLVIPVKTDPGRQVA